MNKPDTAPLFNTFTLDAPILLGGVEIIAAGTEIKVRKPDSGALRGMTLMALSQLDVNALAQLAPRITEPTIPQAAIMDPADLMQFGGEVMDFLLPKAAKAAVSPTA